MLDSNAVEAWQQRIRRARERREQFEPIWRFFVKLHSEGKHCLPRDVNDDPMVTFPNGDQIRAALIHRNIEQTLALLEVPEIGVRVTATDYTFELGAADTHREGVVEQALYHSLMNSGLLTGPEEIDYIKRDALIIGHGVSYTHWRVVEQEMEVGQVPVLEETESGAFVPAARDGLPDYEPIRERRVTFEGCQDEQISPFEFLFDAGARRMTRAPWHGFERPVKLDALRADPRYDIPDDVVGQTFRLADIYDDDKQDGLEELTDAVNTIVIWDLIERRLLTFIEVDAEGSTGSTRKPGKKTQNPPRQLIEILNVHWPVTFTHPDDSPFRFLIPIPANHHPFGVSQIEHARNQAMEADKLRTRQANITRQIKRIVGYQKGRVDDKQLEEAKRSPDLSFVSIEVQPGEKPEQLFYELPVPSVHPDLYKQYQEAERGVDKNTGISDVAGGGADTATEAEHIFEIGAARPRRKKRLIMSFLSAIAGAHRDFMREFAPPGQTIVVADFDGRPLTLGFGREAFTGALSVEVIAGGGALGLSPVRQKLMAEIFDRLRGQYGPAFDQVLLRQMLTMFDVRGVNELMRAARAGFGLAPPAPGAVPAPAFALNDYSNAQAIRAGINAPNEG